MGIPVDFGDVEVQSFEALPIGRYPVKVVDVAYTEQAGDKAPYVAWEYDVTEGEYAGRKIFHNTSLEPDARWSIKRTLLALGLTKEEIESHTWDFEDPEVVDALMERECIIGVGHRKFEGENRTQVRSFFTSEGARPGREAGPGSGAEAPF